MDWIQRLNTAIGYIEENLDGEIDYEVLGQRAGCTAYQFQRMFCYMAGVNLAEYIRRRRMSRAVADLQSSDAKILDIALKYGYHSPTAFNRAFQSLHGVPPSQVKNPAARLISYPPISFKIIIKGAEEMEYRIENKEAFRIVGLGMPLSGEMEENFRTIPQKWIQAGQDGTLQTLCGIMEGMGVLGVSEMTPGCQGRYYIAVPSSKPLPAGMEEATIPAATWAIFQGEGAPQSIQALQSRIMTEWFPSSGYEFGKAPDIEVYLDNDPVTSHYEVWVPVVKK